MDTDGSAVKGVVAKEAAGWMHYVVESGELGPRSERASKTCEAGGGL